MKPLGDIKEDATINFDFATHVGSTATTLLGTPLLCVYKGNSTTQSTAGLTLTVDFDSITGCNHVVIDTSADAFYEPGYDYSVKIAAGTVGGTSVVGIEVAHFSIENRVARVYAMDDYTINTTTVTDPINANIASVDTDAISALGISAGAVTKIQNGLATSANQTTILNRIGAITGSGVNTLLGFFKALLSKTATVPSDIGGAFDPATDSTEAIRDHGDSAWTTADVSSLATSTEVGSNKTILDKVDSAMVADGLVYKFTANALEESPAASGGLTVAQDAKLTTIYNEITTDSEITVTSPVVSSNGTITIVRGYDYKDADDRSIEFTSEIWPNLTSATVKMAQRDAARTNWSTMSVVTAGGTGVTQKVRLELEDTFTDDLSAGRLLLRICATLSNGDIVDLGEVAIEVK